MGLYWPAGCRVPLMNCCKYTFFALTGGPMDPSTGTAYDALHNNISHCGMLIRCAIAYE